jgi:hypothetical protein
VIYGPFNYDGGFISDGNRRLHDYLKAAVPGGGIRDFEAMDELADTNDLHLLEDNDMPANNRLIIWRKGSPIR